MSSPISIPATNQSRASDMAARSVPVNANGSSNVYIPVHRRGASAASLPERSALRSHFAAVPAPRPGPRSLSPSVHTLNHYDTPASADIPTASTIPTTYTYTVPALLALSSSPAAVLSPPQHAEVAGHIPLMLRRAASPSSRSRSPTRPATAVNAAAGGADTLPKKPEAAPLRRRRTGRKSASAKARVPPSVGADVEERRRRSTYGAGWGWRPAERVHVAGQRVEFGRAPQLEGSWRAAQVSAAAAA
ncbi:hypothetical protein BC628DRAFT_1341131 [Trametes gibbosa]|nr:hypothetical protein BC628DRAFT_1341131 [Trametes gibbosa]